MLKLVNSIQIDPPRKINQTLRPLFLGSKGGLYNVSSVTRMILKAGNCLGNPLIMWSKFEEKKQILLKLHRFDIKVLLTNV